MKFRTNARVALTIEVSAHSSWSETTTIDQIRQQAISDAIGQIRNATERHAFRVIGDPIVTIVTAAEDRP